MSDQGTSRSQARLAEIERTLAEGAGTLTAAARAALEAEWAQLEAELSRARAQRLVALEARIDAGLLATPRGSGIVYPPPDADALTALRGQEPEGPLQTIGRAGLLLASAGMAVDHLCPPAGGPRGASDPERLDRLAVGAFRLLWGQIVPCRVLLEVCEDDVVALRRLRPHRCALGTFPSATHAAQRLVETVLAEVWKIAWAGRDPGPPYTRRWLFEVDGHLPPFEVDWWYQALPALRSHGADLAKHGDLAPDSGLNAALLQEAALCRRRLRQARRKAAAGAPAAPTGEKRAQPPAEGGPLAEIAAVVCRDRAAPTGPATPPTAALTAVLTPEDTMILKALVEQHPRTMYQEEIAAAARLARGTVRARLTYLRQCGLTHRPHGKKKGEALTPAGLQHASAGTDPSQRRRP
jgi:hypothetical protein